MKTIPSWPLPRISIAGSRRGAKPSPGIGQTNGGGMADYLLDTGILIRYLRKSPGYDRLLDEFQQRSSLVISAYTRLEIIRGMCEREREVTLDLLNRMITMPVNIQNADLAGELIRGWREKGFVLSD